MLTEQFTTSVVINSNYVPNINLSISFYMTLIGASIRTGRTILRILQ